MSVSPELVTRLEAAVAKLEKLSGGRGGASDEDVSPQSEAYADFTLEFLNPMLTAIRGLGEEASADIVAKVFANAGRLIEIASKTKKPTTEERKELQTFMGLKPAMSAMRKVKDMGISQALEALVDSCRWVVTDGVGTIDTARSGLSTVETKFSRSVMDAKNDVEKLQRRAALLATKPLMAELPKYIKKFHTTGVTWNANGKAFSLGGAAAAAPAAASAAPATKAPAAAAAAAAGPAKPQINRAALFGALSKGADATKGLKKVTDDQKTKNRPLSERSGAVPATVKKVAPKKPAASAKPVVQKAPSIELVGGQFFVEHFTLEGAEANVQVPKKKHGVFVNKCGSAKVVIKSTEGLFKQLTVNDCKGTTIFLDKVVSTVELVNSSSVTVVVGVGAPSIALDGCDSVSVVIMKAAQEVMPLIVTSKISACNIVFAEVAMDPQKNVIENAYEVVKETPIPEQFSTKCNAAGEWVTEPVSHGG